MRNIYKKLKETLFKYKVVVFTLCHLFVINCLASANEQTDIQYLRKRIIESTLKIQINDDQIKQIIETARLDGTWPNIDYSNVSRTAFEHTRHLSNLTQLAFAYRKKESKWHENKQVKQVFDKGLSYWLAHDFICENWWNNEIGTPSAFITMLLVMDKHLNNWQIENMLKIARRANLNASGARPSGDRIHIASLQMKTALFCMDIPQVMDVMKVIEGEIKIVPPGHRGIQADYSFHHRPDRVNNTLSYGLNYINIFAEWADLVATTCFRFSEKSIQRAIDYYLDGICKQMVYGRTEDPSIQNRDITRIHRKGYFDTVTPERLIHVSNYRKKELINIIKARKGEAFTPTSFAKFFWQTEHFVFQRPNFYTSVRMFSTRNKNMEEAYNGEGLKNHFRADGANYLSVTGSEYFNLAPVFDWCYIPGATTCVLDEMPSPDEIQKEGIMDFVGGVTDGKYGAVTFDFRSPHHPLKAKKSWFFFDQEYVCLGSGIHSPTTNPVITTVNQTHLHGPVLISDGTTNKTIAKGEHNLNGVKWVWHDNIGYIFPDTSRIRLKNQETQGTWFSVNCQTDSPKDTIRMNVFKLWNDHGIRPKQESYSYIVRPNISVTGLTEYQQEIPIAILSNTEDLQAVEHTKKGIAYMACYRATEQKMADGQLVLKVHSPALIMVSYHPNGILKSLTVSDPSRKLSHIHVSFSGKYENPQCSNRIQCNYVDSLRETFLSVELPKGDEAGKSISVLF